MKQQYVEYAQEAAPKETGEKLNISNSVSIDGGKKLRKFRQ
jgi:hypothetical protein